MDLEAFCEEAEKQIMDVALAFGYMEKTLKILQKPEHMKVRRELFEGLYRGAIVSRVSIDSELAFMGARRYIIGFTQGAMLVSLGKDAQISEQIEIYGWT